MVDQNSYGPEQYCTECGGPLEKARSRTVKNAKCIKCKKAHIAEYVKSRSKIKNIIKK